MKKLIVLSVAFLFALGTFANTGHKKEYKAKTKTQATASVSQTPSKKENKVAAKKDVKATKNSKGTKKAEVKKVPVSNVK